MVGLPIGSPAPLEVPSLKEGQREVSTYLYHSPTCDVQAHLPFQTHSVLTITPLVVSLLSWDLLFLPSMKIDRILRLLHMNRDQNTYNATHHYALDTSERDVVLANGLDRMT